jgi:hypothetical protein
MYIIFPMHIALVFDFTIVLPHLFPDRQFEVLTEILHSDDASGS